MMLLPTGSRIPVAALRYTPCVAGLAIQHVLTEFWPGKRDEILRVWWLWVGLFFLGLLLILIVAALGKRRRMTMSAAVRAKSPPIKDAWAEAGKRIEAPPEGPAGDADGGRT